MKYIIRTYGGWNEDHYSKMDDAISAIIELLDVEELFRESINSSMNAMDFGAYGQILPADALEACDHCAYRTMLSDYENYDLWIAIRDQLEYRENVIFGVSVEYEEEESA